MPQMVAGPVLKLAAREFVEVTRRRLQNQVEKLVSCKLKALAEVWWYSTGRCKQHMRVGRQVGRYLALHCQYISCLEVAGSHRSCTAAAAMPPSNYISWLRPYQQTRISGLQSCCWLPQQVQIVYIYYLRFGVQLWHARGMVNLDRCDNFVEV